jgi:hypothetical protein
MKVSIKPFILLLVIAVGIVLANHITVSPSTALAQAADTAAVAVASAPAETVVASPEAPPEWLASAIEMAKSVPYLGPVIVEILKWMGVLASLLTALTTLLVFLAKLADKLGKTLVWMDKAKVVLDKLVFYIGYLSMFNVVKDEKDDKTKIK